MEQEQKAMLNDIWMKMEALGNRYVQERWSTCDDVTKQRVKMAYLDGLMHGIKGAEGTK